MDFRVLIYLSYFAVNGMACEYFESFYMNRIEFSNYYLNSILSLDDKREKFSSLNIRPWPNGRIPYKISRKFSFFARVKIRITMNDFHKSTCVRFVPYSSEKTYIHIISNDDIPCRSFIGYTGNSYDVNLAESKCLKVKGNVIHELMHAIGFFHEQCRSDRDKYVTVLYENIPIERKMNFVRIEEYQFDDTEIPYDYESIMHYRRNAFSINGKPTIVAKNNESMQLGQYIGLSKGDIQKINKKYLCDEMVTQAQSHNTTREDDGSASYSQADVFWTQYFFSKYYSEESIWMEGYYFLSDFTENIR